MGVSAGYYQVSVPMTMQVIINTSDLEKGFLYFVYTLGNCNAVYHYGRPELQWPRGALSSVHSLKPEARFVSSIIYTVQFIWKLDSPTVITNANFVQIKLLTGRWRKDSYSPAMTCFNISRSVINTHGWRPM